MLKIGDVARQFSISSRTLRYWEEAGILDSSRMENGYRIYDSENEARIRQIVLLRRLKMPISAIEEIFIKADFETARDAISAHLENLKQEAAGYNSLIDVTERLLNEISGSHNLEQMFFRLEAHSSIDENDQNDTSQIQLSPRSNRMSTKQLSNVRIVRIPAMTVASYRAESSTPEDDCSKVFNKFVLENKLHKRSAYRYFGFNNPIPMGGKAVYGYEMWVTIPEDFKVPQPLVKKQFGGGLYASISTQMNEIGERWKLLNEWCESSETCDADFSFQWLEECTMDFETFISDKVRDSDKQLDLLEPIKLR